MEKIYLDGEETRYSVSDSNGGVRNDITGRVLKSHPNPKGYLIVKLYHNGGKCSKTVHRLVMETFAPLRRADMDEVNHLTPPDENGIKWDNDIDSLDWTDGSGNVKHAFDTGLKQPKYGSEHPNTKFDEDLVHEICRMLESDIPTRKIRKKLNITNQYLVSNIKRRKYWNHISKNYDF